LQTIASADEPVRRLIHPRPGWDVDGLPVPGTRRLPPIKRFGDHVLDLGVWPDPLPEEMAVPLAADTE